ncbi:LOW QUALITY PROTEIN: synaptotagmin-11-like [Gadus macrocephalus]|uniref:LOW QUALITY PROTEIN: synaptotagmin-11-like n=1 Tax=Gadus macrocephalus TaxID=80720 RepID=UPI0028CB4336|nr:LOW QUALITY PROTEIN: synaptotagmin-11-like [Gadus macrocephalus]
MAEISELRAAYVMSPVLAGFLGAGVLVVVVVVLVVLWTFCQRRYQRSAGRHKLYGDRYCDPPEDPPYKFIHMLKGISIYPESLSSSQRIFRGAPGARVRRADRGGDAERAGGGAARGMVLVDAENNILDVPGQLHMSHLVPPGGAAAAAGGGGVGGARLDRALPVRADYCCLESSESGSSGSENGGSKTGSPFTPAWRRRGGGPDGEPALGTISLAVDYNFPKKALVVTILGARGLPAVGGGEGGASADPYVKMTILPEKKHRVKTRVLRKTLEPQFDETFTFYGVAYSSLSELTLHFLVLSFDRFARDDVIGESLVPLKGVDPSTGRVHLSQQISKRSMLCESRGELLVSLSYQPVSHRLSVVVLKARHLPKMDITGLSANPYVKVNVFYGRKRIGKKKTHVKKCTLNPVFNESFIYDVPPELLPEISVEFLVVDFDRTTKNEVLGRLPLGLHSPCPSGTSHWTEVCENPRRQISKWHSLIDY